MVTRSRKSSRGFTLIELMAVVVITGILAVLATLSYTKFMRSAHVTEATSMIGNIRAAQEAYRSETLQYLDVSSAFGESNWFPNTPSGLRKTAWAAPGGSAPDNARWMQLAVKADAPVVFGYETKAGAAGTGPASPSFSPSIAGWSSINFPSASADPWYVIVAGADVDKNNTRCYVVGSSWTGEIYIEKEGE